MDKQKILIIDDDPDLVEGFRIMLEANGYEVETADNGSEGLDKIRPFHPDLIILDVMMDTITEGFQVSQKLRSPDPRSEYRAVSDIPILMLSGISKKMNMAFSPEKDEGYLPVDEFVEKPIRLESLLEKVKELLKKS